MYALFLLLPTVAGSSKKHSTGGAIPGEKCPKHNWSQHADAHANFSNQNKHLRTNFLYSLSTHKPHIEGEMAARYASNSSQYV